jgi:hypothetical protein
MKKVITAILLAMSLAGGAMGETREFVHPGMSYTADDLARMRDLIDREIEPAYSTFLALQASSYSKITAGTFSDITAIAEGKHNNTVGVDGRKAHDLALLYRLTDDTRYAEEALKHLNRYNNLTNVSCNGTGPLDAGKVYLLLEAAELMRDYPGWAAADQEAFKAMLVHPGYSKTAYPSDDASYDESLNNITFYWNISNLDPTRWGNQGLFAARAMMAMAIYLDNESMYDRVVRYMNAQGAADDDLPFHKIVIARGGVKESSDYMITYNFKSYDADEQFISDAAIPYYIYGNGQCEESCRDQAHSMVGLGQLVDIAEMAWNQGDDLYAAFDNRILTGLEWSLRYNLSYLQNPEDAWEPSGYSETEDECTFDNGMFYGAYTRSQRWHALKPYDGDRVSSLNAVRYLQQALAHYQHHTTLATSAYQWLSDAAAYQLANSDNIENWGTSGHHYEWKGWGTLTMIEPEIAGGTTTEVSGVAVNAATEPPVAYDTLGRRVSPDTKGLIIVNGVKVVNR